MTNDRLHQRKLTVGAALAELEDRSGRQFDPDAVAAIVTEMSPVAVSIAS
jgi:HD-GYP domain-containing protein (c-di-GMP phosphodiesterase class II)